MCKKSETFGFENFVFDVSVAVAALPGRRKECKILRVYNFLWRAVKVIKYK